MEHRVKHIEGYGYADYCDCGEQSFVCQHCGRARCINEHKTSKGKNACIRCFLRNNTLKAVSLKNNPAYDLMM